MSTHAIFTAGDRFRLFVKRHYGTLERLGAAIGMSPQSLSRYQTATFKPSFEVLERMAKAGLNIHWLVTGEGPMLAASAQQEIGLVPLAPPEQRRLLELGEIIGRASRELSTIGAGRGC